MEQTVRSGGGRRTRIAGKVAGICASAGLILGLSACGFNVQTLQTYQPADGVDVNVAVNTDGLPAVKVRGLMILSKSETSGFLSATFTPSADDELTGVSGTLLKPDDAGDAGALKIGLSSPVQLTAGHAVVLTDQQNVKITGDKLQPGLNARLTLKFAKAGSQQVTVPIIDGNTPTYSGVSPSAAAPSSDS